MAASAEIVPLSAAPAVPLASTSASVVSDSSLSVAPPRDLAYRSRDTLCPSITVAQQQELLLQDIEVIRFLGLGNKVAAYVARNARTGEVFVLRALHALSPLCRPRIQNEITNTAKFAAYNGVLGYVGTWQTRDKVYWIGVAESCGSVDSAVLKLGGFSLPSAAQLATQVSDQIPFPSVTEPLCLGFRSTLRIAQIPDCSYECQAGTYVH